MTHQNRSVRLARYPVGRPTAADFAVLGEPRRDPAVGELLVRVEHVSLNPAMRNWVRPDQRSSLPGVALGDVVRAEAVGRIEASHDDRFAAGEAVFGMFGVQEWATVSPQRVVRVDETLAPAAAHLGVLGLQGLAAYFGVHDVGRVRAGETVVVTGAAGAVGSIAGQLARLLGARVIGIVGGPVKTVRLVNELGFAAAINHRCGDISRHLRELAPEGVDVCVDNVGGPILDDVLANLAVGARIVLCGATSQYDDDGPMHGPVNYFQLVHRRARMTGFLVMDFADQHADARRALGALLAGGSLHAPDHVLGTGVDAFPAALGALFSGQNFGKALLQISP